MTTRERKPRYLVDAAGNGNYVRAWKEGRGHGEIMVQVWLGKSEPTGEPDGDWAMPGMLGWSLAIDIAVAQTKLSTQEAR